MTTSKTDHSGMKLGKPAPVLDSRTLKLGDYVDSSTLPPVPAQFFYGKNIAAWGMMANDKINDCTCAAAGHLIMEWTGDNGAMITPTDEQITQAYSGVTGYNPATGQNNTGAGMLPVLNYWRQTGVASHKIMAYATLTPKDHNHIMLSVYLFGGCYVGLMLPTSAKTQDIWTVPQGGAQGDGAVGSWGGHAVAVIGYDGDGLTVVTWGITKQMTWEFWDTYCDESYAIISTDFANKNPSPDGFDLASLQEDLKEIGG